MTKARDLAGAANSAVNSTEIGYLDGVTSSVQTQLDAKIAKSLVDAKGDLVAATAADTVDRLAVGSNGETLVADSSATTGLRWTATPAASNPVINGGFDIWQRGTSLSVAASTPGYTADRWYFYNRVNQASTISRQATGDTTNLPNIQYCARVQRNSGQTGTQIIYFVQGIETVNSIPFAGKTVTLSFYARKGADYSGTFNSNILYGTGTDQNPVTGYTGQVDNVQTKTLTTTWQRFTQTVTIATTATEIGIEFSFVNPTGTAGAADYFEVTGVQLDIGSVALPFRRSGNTLAGEFLACQRYFQRFVGGLGLPYPAYSTGTTQIFGAVQMPIKMRTAPSITVGGTIYFFNSSAEVSAASPTVDFSDMYEGGGRLRLAGFTGLTSGLLTMAYYNQGHISLSAEL